MNIRKFLALSTSLAAATTLLSCGRYGPPVPPEQVAPKEVEEVVITPQTGSILLAWHSPAKDRKGRELRDLDGYVVLRQEYLTPVVAPTSAPASGGVPAASAAPTPIPTPTPSFEAVAQIPDNHIREREKRRAEARESGKISRKVDVSESEKRFTYTDRNVKSGYTYGYKIVATNHGGVYGKIKQLYSVAFSGAASTVTAKAADDDIQDQDTEFTE